MVRAFVALELSDEIRTCLGAAQEVLKRCNAHMTWVEPKNIHITLKFMGDVDERKIEQVATALRSITFRHFLVSTGVITVNNPRRPFTVWCAIEDGGFGKRLFQLVEDVLSPLGFTPEKRQFTPHATVARVKRFDPSLLTVLSSLTEKTYGTCMVEGMKLKKSTLMPQGPVYEDLMEVTW